MSTYNTNSSYSRSYEKKIIEETPRVRLSSPFSSTLPSGIPEHMFPSHAFPSSLGNLGAGGLGTGTGGTFHSIKTTDDSISITMDVKDFKPEDIKVSVVGKFIVVDAKHGEKTDDMGTIERSFTRKIPLPKGVHPEAVTSNLTTDGVLTIVALPPKPKENSPQRTIPIKVQVSPTEQKTV